MDTLSMRKRISFFGNFGQQNLGNECTLQAMIYNVRKFLPNADISCICTDSEDTAARYNISAFSISERYVKRPNSGARVGQENIVIKSLRRILIRMPMELYGWVRAFKILKNLHFVADTYGLVIHDEDEKRAIAGFTSLLTLWATSRFGSPRVYE